MGFWWFMFICDLLIPLSMLICSKILLEYAPKKVSYLVGYKTARSTKSAETWKFAQEYCGRLWGKIGWATLIPSVIVHLPFYKASEDTVGTVSVVLCSMQIAVILATVFMVERALKTHFDDEGNFRSAGWPDFV